MVIDKVALTLAVIGALNWGSIACSALTSSRSSAAVRWARSAA